MIRENAAANNEIGSVAVSAFDYFEGFLGFFDSLKSHWQLLEFGDCLSS
jgi:hypothetical protein